MGKNHIVLHISANCKARVIGQSYRSHSGSRRERGSLIQLVVSCKQLLAGNLVGLVGQKRASRRSESLCHSSSKPTSGYPPLESPSSGITSVLSVIQEFL